MTLQYDQVTREKLLLDCAGTAAGQLPGSPGAWLEVAAPGLCLCPLSRDQLPQLSRQLTREQLQQLVVNRVEGAGLVLLGPAPAPWSRPLV